VSARTDLVDALTAALPGQYRVVGSPSCPDLIEVDTFAVRCWTARLAPGDLVGRLSADLVVWVLSPRMTPGDTDDDLDGAYADVAGALHDIGVLLPATAERSVMEDDDGPRWHGWRFTFQATTDEKG
jgi:hypothetical protein